MVTEWRISWDEFADDIARLAELIRTSNYGPDMIVAVARGGWISARFLSDAISVKKLVSIGLQYLDAERSSIEVYSFPKPVPPEGKLLLVEDVLESAKTALVAKELLAREGAKVRVACLYYKPTSILVPDYSLGPIDCEFRMPWENSQAQ